MIKKEYIVPAVKAHKLELHSILAGSPDPENPDWDNTVIPGSNNQGEEDEGENL